jgi:hypothetical protein
LTPIQPIYPSEVAAVEFSSAQQRKIDQLVAKVSARAKKPYTRYISLMRKIIDQLQTELILTKRLADLLGTLPTS